MVQSLYTRACCRPTFSSFRPIQENRKTQETDVESKQEIIKQSIASYRGSYPCPYIPIARKGAVADAAQTAGGAAPLWYEKDVMQKMVDEVSEEDVAVGTSDLPSSFTSPTSRLYVHLTKNLNFPDADFLDITTVLVRPRLVSSGPSFFRRTERAWLLLSAIPKPTTQRKMLVLPAAE